MTNEDATGEAERITTFEQAQRVNPYELARRWGANEWPVKVPREAAEAAGIRPREVVDDLEELAVMAALRKCLEAWAPGQIHGALLAGATVEQVAAASGLNPFEMSVQWREWADGQRHLQETMPDLPDRSADYDRVQEILHSVPAETYFPRTEAGYSPPTQEPGQ